MLGLLSLPPWCVEPAFAVTIVFSAFDDLRMIFHGTRALVTFAFGLIHGFGLTGALAELSLPASRAAWALLRFNLGLETGQLMIVMMAGALLDLLRKHRRYPTWVIRGRSVAAIVVGVQWFIERTGDASVLTWQRAPDPMRLNYNRGSQGNAQPPQVSLTPTGGRSPQGGGLGGAQISTRTRKACRL